jgi:glycosyltransferase involved in cell wall biosynthesis
MKLSFLIPSKNRLELLKYAVDSVLRLGCADFEIVISDNASEEDYGGYVRDLGNRRIIYRRVERPVSVTENWNNALAMASGDYVLMLGDDDAVAPNFVSMISPLLQGGEPPDVVFLAAYHYCYPRVIPSQPDGYFADVRNSRFFEGHSSPFRLPREEAVAVAMGVFGFRYLFGFNSQHFLFRAEFLREISYLGGIFQSPYPDTFAAIVSFLKAKSVTVVPDPMVIIGISPKSFGYYYFNDRSDEGYAFLNNEAVSPEIRAALEGVVLPGNRNNTNWLVAAEAARRALQKEFDCQLDIRRYRVLQLVAFLREIYLVNVRQVADVAQFESKLSRDERAVFAGFRAAIEGAAALGHSHVAKVFAEIDRSLEQFWPARVQMIDIGKHSSIADAVEWLRGHMSGNVAIRRRGSWRRMLRLK